jgi:hypothetical protein
VGLVGHQQRSAAEGDGHGRVQRLRDASLLDAVGTDAEEDVPVCGDDEAGRAVAGCEGELAEGL